MKPQRLLVAFGIGLGLTLLTLVALVGSPAQATTGAACNRYVVNSGSNSSNCANSATPCKTIQYALGQAAIGDVICVADRSDIASPSTYYGTVVVTKSVTLDGAWQAACGTTCVFTPTVCVPQNVVVDGQGTGRVISISNASPTINCFTITGGDANGLGGDPGGTVEDDAGGGIYGRDASPIIVNNIITGNYGCDFCSTTYGRGGGIYLIRAGATAIISNNLIANNVADNSTWGQGGGIMLRDSDAQVLSNTIQYNRAGFSAGYGGGITVKDGQPTIARNHVLHNVAGQSVQGLGGGIFVWSSTPTTIEQNLVEYNRAIAGDGDPILISRGGGICVTGDPTISVLIRDNTIRLNVASPYTPTGYGGGMYLSNLVSPSLVNGNTLEGNVAGFNWNGSGGGIYVNQSEATVVDNDIFDNSATWSGSRGEGGGVYINSGAVLLNGNVITSNHGAYFTGFPSFSAGYGGGLYINYSLTTTLTSNQIRSNLASRDGGGIYISQGSPIISHNDIHANQVISGYGGGLYLNTASAQVIGNQIVSNTVPAQGGGGIYAIGDSSLIQFNSILSNSANYAGGGIYIYSNSSTRVDGNTIAGNRANLYGGGVASRQPNSARVVNNMIARNAANQSGGGVYLYRTETEIVFNTIVDNQRGGSATGIYIGSAASYTPTIVNNIVVSHATGIQNTAAGMTPIVDYNDVWSNSVSNYIGVAAGAHDISVNPLFLDSVSNNYHLRSGSPCIDAGTTITGVTTDVDGDLRPIGPLPDIGADEKTSVCDRYVLNVDTTDVGRNCSDPTHPCRTVTYALGQALDGDRICIADHPLQPGPSVYTGTHTVNKSVTLDGAWQAMCVDPSDLTCSFWAVPCNPANVALDAQGAGSVVNISPPSGRITSTVRCLTLTGGRASEGAGINMNNASATIISNIITNNVADSYGGGINVESSSAVITANAILSNSAGYGGGGIEMTVSTVLLKNNHISQNHADYGGGLELDRTSATVMNNLVNYNQSSSAWMVSGAGSYKLVVVNNAVVNNEGAGIRIYNYRADVVHNTIASNTGAGVEGYFTATLVMTNNVVAYNSGASIMTSTGGSAIASYNLFWLNSSDPITGTYAVLGDPALLADGYHLGPGSAAIDRGVATWMTTDIDGDPRPIGPLPDIGADEYYFRVYLPLVLRNY